MLPTGERGCERHCTEIHINKASRSLTDMHITNTDTKGSALALPQVALPYSSSNGIILD